MSEWNWSSREASKGKYSLPPMHSLLSSSLFLFTPTCAYMDSLHKYSSIYWAATPWMTSQDLWMTPRWMNGDAHLALKEDITWDDMMGTQKNLTCFQHVTIFLSIASFFLESFYKTWEAIKANFKVGNNERAAGLQYLKKKPVTHRACSNHAICKADFGRSRSVCRVSCRNSANSCLSWNLRLLRGKKSQMGPL